MTEETTNFTEAPMVLDNQSSRTLFYWWQPYLSGFGLTLMGVAMVPGNLLTSIACIKYKDLRSPAHLLILNQSIGDLISAVMAVNIGLPRVLTRSYSRGRYYCLFSLAGIILATETSMLNLMAISVDRFVAVVFTYKYQTWVTSRSLTVSICIIWSFAIITQLLPVIGWNIYDAGDQCQTPHVLPSLFFSLFFTLPVLTSLLLTAIGNVIIGIIALKKSKKIGDIEHESGALLAKTQLKVTKMLFLVVGTFYACWMPYVVMANLFRYPPKSWRFKGIPESASFAFSLSLIFALFSPLLNPFIYAYKDKNLRRAFSKLLGICHPSDDHQDAAP